ncbi:MAG: hypothetical protein V4436_02725 [Patescibacteria group bacterium]
MKQKIIKIGSSIGVVIPKAIAEERGFRAGGNATFTLENDSNRIIIEPSVVQEKPGIDQDILSWTNEFVDKNRELLKRLADK